MSWKIVYSSQARQDLRCIFEYISNELCAPDTAANQSRRIMKSIRDLEEMPMRYSLYEDEPWNSMGLRFFPVDNYLGRTKKINIKEMQRMVGIDMIQDLLCRYIMRRKSLKDTKCIMHLF